MTSKEKTAYRKTTKWKEYRQHKLEESDYTCALCGIHKKKGLQIHHINPAAYGNERDEDTVVVCFMCHKFIELKWKTLKNKKNVKTKHSLLLFAILKDFHL